MFPNKIIKKHKDKSPSSIVPTAAKKINFSESFQLFDFIYTQIELESGILGGFEFVWLTMFRETNKQVLATNFSFLFYESRTNKQTVNFLKNTSQT